MIYIFGVGALICHAVVIICASYIVYYDYSRTPVAVFSLLWAYICSLSDPRKCIAVPSTDGLMAV